MDTPALVLAIVLAAGQIHKLDPNSSQKVNVWDFIKDSLRGSYLTVPFVPSRSMMEAMSSGATLVSSDVAPVSEIITDGQTCHLVDFLKPKALAKTVVNVLSDHQAHQVIGRAARDHIIKTYDFKPIILPRQLEMMDRLQRGVPPSYAQIDGANA